MAGFVVASGVGCAGGEYVFFLVGFVLGDGAGARLCGLEGSLFVAMEAEALRCAVAGVERFREAMGCL